SLFLQFNNANIYIILICTDNKLTKILIVDDNEDLLFVLSDGFNTQYNSICAQNAKAAINELDKENGHLIITDIMMPEIDGLSFCDTIKSDFRYIRSLLRNSEKIQNYYASPLPCISPLLRIQILIKYLWKPWTNILMRIFMNPDLDVALLAKCMNMSRTNLYRKISSISIYLPPK